MINRNFLSYFVIFLLVASLTLIFEASSVSAVCCEKVVNGGWCVDADQSQCDSDYSSSPNACNGVNRPSFCAIGICLDTESGWCAPGSPKQKCISDGGEWSDVERTECDMGCCYLYENTHYTTRAACGIESGISIANFSTDVSELACRFLTEDEGACIYSGGCTWTSNAECFSTWDGIDFIKGAFCSSEELENEYEYDYIPNSSQICYNGDIYWRDSNNNREGLAENCIDSTHVCDDSTGVPYCKSTVCVDQYGDQRSNGESWCDYDAYVGNSKDYVGSEHCKMYCDDGEVKVDKCSIKRGEVCAEKTDPITGFKTAQMRTNLWKECLHIDNAADCNDNPDCRLQNVNVDTYFKFDACVPRYPPGFDVYSDEGLEICALANIPCPAVWDDDSSSGDDLEANGKCDDPIYIEQMHNLCTSLGDCGSYFNYVGNYTYTGPEQEFFDEVNDCRRTIDNYLIAFYDNRCTSGYTCGGITVKEKEDCVAKVSNFRGFQDKFNTSLGDPPKWITNYRSLSLLKPESLELINDLIAGQGEAVGNGWWEDQGIGDGAAGQPDIFYKYTSFSCIPWGNPSGGDRCEECNSNPLIKCTDYRCESLGSACLIIPDTYGTDNPICVDMFSADPAPPQISFGAIDTKYHVAEGVNGANVSLLAGGCPEKHTNLSFTLNTDENARCVTYYISPSGAKHYMLNENTFSKVHYVDELYLGVDNNLRLFTICQDPAGNPNVNEYIVNICVSPQPDQTAPEIKKYTPESRSYIPYGVTTQVTTLKLNEPAVCSYSRTPYTPIENMLVLCESDDTGIGPYSCSGELNNLTSPQNDIFIKCNDSLGNFHATDNVYTLYKTNEALSIQVNSPVNGSIRETPININNPLILDVTTSKGSYSGKSVCSYKFLVYGWRDEFFTTGDKRHTQRFDSEFENGDYNILVTCEDAAKNIAENLINLKISIDKSPPNITSVVNETTNNGVNVRLTTDEPAECWYNTRQCSTNFSNQQSATIGRDTKHLVPNIDPKLSYYLTCKDEHENVNPSCAYVIEATESNDGKAPDLVRVFYDSEYTGYLKLFTNEDSQCYYTADRCDFDIEDGVPMATGYGFDYQQGEFIKEHSAAWNTEMEYHVKCKDSWNNTNNGCLVVVEAFEMFQSNL